MKYAIYFSVALLLAALAGCFKDKDIDAAESRLRSMMKDPDAVKFESVKGYGNGVVCGMFNAKNGYGAYVGSKPFIVTREDSLLEVPIPSSMGTGASLDVYCKVLNHLAVENEKKSTTVFADACDENLKKIAAKYVGLRFADLSEESHKRSREIDAWDVLTDCGVTKYKLFYEIIETAENEAIRYRNDFPLRMVGGSLSKLRAL